MIKSGIGKIWRKILWELCVLRSVLGFEVLDWEWGIVGRGVFWIGWWFFGRDVGGRIWIEVIKVWVKIEWINRFVRVCCLINE